MNIISDKKVDKVMELYSGGASVREVARVVGIAKETAHRLQGVYFVALIDGGDDLVVVKVNKVGSRAVLAKDIPLRWVKRAFGQEISRAGWLEYLSG